jgi:hypothetical protein
MTARRPRAEAARPAAFRPHSWEEKMKKKSHIVALTSFAVAASAVSGAVAAQALPKEGRLDTTSCWSGVSNTIAFSKTHTALSYEFMGTTRSNPPGGAWDMTAFRCVGLLTIIDGKSPGTAICEASDKDGDKWMSQYVCESGKCSGTALAGTGKYDGMVFSANTENSGPFPPVKPGTFQNCNRAIGNYKLK